ncbi:methionyl-tRNA formyltransferase [Allonocardiopsis opalescens]|uniref:Methionyl-tRNA formyltransferase n=1 Tax=Allonocardiopsis opalescens TaxID=1144618 RepID=A0A2T0Q071_9ACTN|nr:formyltransferase family protein [Allonocardiopsis opalescens]PRX97166.1 methionyl-tRNA formyltransferase [Allonocardiopsis opalescens]
MSDSMRVGVISSGPAEFDTIQAACTDAGHPPVVYFYGRSLRPGGPNLTEAGETTAAILEAVPPGMDLILPESMAGLAAAIENYRVDLLIVFGFPWKLPRAVRLLPNFGAMNVHVSVLPKYRGPAPLLWAIRNGDPTGGVTVHWMDDDFDTGNILAQQDGIPLEDDITWDGYCAVALPIVYRLLRESLALAAVRDPGTPQDHSAATYAGFMDDDFSTIDWSNSAKEIHNQVRTHRFMRSPRDPVADVGKDRVHVIRTSLTPAHGQKVVCGDGRPLWIVESEQL